jgi:hypothetical protein
VSLVRYTILVLGIALGTLALAWTLLLRPADEPVRWAAVSGCGLAVVNTLAAHALVLASAGRSAGAFLRLVLGGMVGRMALMLAAVLAGVLLLGLPKLPLALSLLSYFVLFLVLELSVLHRSSAASVAAGR